MVQEQSAVEKTKGENAGASGNKEAHAQAAQSEQAAAAKEGKTQQILTDDGHWKRLIYKDKQTKNQTKQNLNFERYIPAYLSFSKNGVWRIQDF